MKLEKGQTSKKDIAVITEDMGDRSVLFTISKEVVTLTVFNLSYRIK